MSARISSLRSKFVVARFQMKIPTDFREQLPNVMIQVEELALSADQNFLAQFESKLQEATKSLGIGSAQMDMKNPGHFNLNCSVPYYILLDVFDSCDMKISKFSEQFIRYNTANYFQTLIFQKKAGALKYIIRNEET